MSLVGYGPWGRKEMDKTEATELNTTTPDNKAAFWLLWGSNETDIRVAS